MHFGVLLAKTVTALQRKGVLVGGQGAFRADGRSQFGCRQVVSLLNAPHTHVSDAFPVTFWDAGIDCPKAILHKFLAAISA